MPHYVDLPASTINLLAGGTEVTVSRAQDWATAALDAGFVDDRVLALYDLNEDETEACSGHVQTALAAVGAWRKTAFGRLGVGRNILVHGLMTDRISTYDFVVGALQIAIDLVSKEGKHLSQDMHRTRDAFYLIHDALSTGRPEPEAVDGVDPKTWIVGELRKAQIVDPEGATVLADWGV